jgi:hypothetical protein
MPIYRLEFSSALDAVQAAKEISRMLEIPEGQVAVEVDPSTNRTIAKVQVEAGSGGSEKLDEAQAMIERGETALTELDFTSEHPVLSVMVPRSESNSDVTPPPAVRGIANAPAFPNAPLLLREPRANDATSVNLGVVIGLLCSALLAVFSVQ